MGALLVLAVAAWRLRTGWLDMYETARHIDDQAGLEARIATMLAHPTSESRSPLRPMLLWQIFDRAHLWEVDRIAPLRIGRPAIAFLVALATFTLTSLLTPENDQEPPTEIAAEGSRTLSAANIAGSGLDHRGIEQDAGLPRHQRAGETSTSEDLNAAPRGTDDQPARPESERSGPAGSPQTRSADGDTDPSSNHEPKRDPGAGELDPPKQKRAEDLKPTDPPPPGQKFPKAEGLDKAPAPAAKSGESTRPPGSDQKRPRPDSKGGSKAAAANPRKGKTGGSRGLLAEKAVQPLAPSEDAKPMVIRLKAFAVKPVDQLEPQGPPSGQDGADSAAPDTQPTSIAPAQNEDSLLQRSVITRAHQDLIRELFTPDEMRHRSPAPATKSN